MTEVIYKYGLAVAEDVEIEMPRGAKVLHVGWQRRDPASLQLWMLVDPTAETEVRHFCVRGTGHALKEPDEGYLRYLGSVVIDTMDFVAHVWEVATLPASKYMGERVLP